MQRGRSQRSERPAVGSGVRTTAGRALKPPASRSSSLRPPTHHAVAAARIDRTGAPSPADSLSSSATAGTKRKERDYEVEVTEDTNINVVVRCRGRNEREVRENSAVAISTDSVRGKAVELSMGPSSVGNKAYNFDRVFSSAADQSMVYDDVVRPIMDDMLNGFNCTIFAYGQTGTGKTYTMSGDMNETLGILSDEAGIIPRVLQSLFRKLNNGETESFVKCSFIELYNEELRDLISPDDNAKLKIYDDNSRKNHATTMVQGMEEALIKDAGEGIKLLQKGSLKRQVAATKCNDLSSRGHTVFTITACVKKVGEDGEDYVNTGKLNLVDLAGSENIQRSGAENKRAAEAGLINKSLLTLGRVINALVDRNSHIPYRESKLTRLLQDSLGGRTKTCIIATVSPLKSNLEETISTLDYAFRAKNIRNKPQTNLMISKKTLFREFTHEIEKLKSELIATRQRNGVYLSNESYEEMTVQNESRRIQNEEQGAKIETLEHNLRNKVQELLDVTSNFMGLKQDHETTRCRLEDTRGILEQTDLILEITRKSLDEEIFVREAHQKTEEEMHAVGYELINSMQRTVKDVKGLHAKNKRKSDLQSLNRSNWGLAQDQVSEVTSLVESRVEEFKSEQDQHIAGISNRMKTFVEAELEKLTSTQSFLDSNLELFAHSKKQLIEQRESSKEEMDGVLEEIKEVRDNIKGRVGESLQAIAAAAECIAQDVLSELGTFHGMLHTSYSSLGKDFKSIFEDLLKHISAQKAESDNLRQQLKGANEVIVQTNASIAMQLQEVISEERRQAAEERQQLLSQITTLIDSQAQTQQSRLADRAASIQQSVRDNNIALQNNMSQYSQGMDSWNEKDDQILGSVTESRDALKSKLKEDWTTANQHSTSIQGTTKSVHAETVRVVDEQMKDLHEQMTSLDDFVTHARSQNAQHRDQNAASLQGLSDTVEDSYARIGDHFRTTFSRVQDLDTDMDTDIGTASNALKPLSEDLSQPLADLREEISATALQEYHPTGETPQKVNYEFPSDLPRTQSRESLLAKFNGESTSPTKPTGAQQIFADADPDLPENRSPSRPASRPASDSAFTMPSLPPASRNSMAMSLREVNLNTASTGGLGFDPRANVTMHGGGFSTTLGPENAAGGGDHTIPLLKKSRTASSRAALAAFAKGAENKGAVPAEGRENVPVTDLFSQSVSRRKSPRLN